MAIAACWAVLAFLAGLPFVADSSLSGGPRAPLAALVVVVVAALPALIGAGFGIAERNSRPAELLRRLPGRMLALLAVAALAAAIVFISGLVSDPPGNSVRTADGYALKLRSGELIAVSEGAYRANSRAERREFLGAALFVNAFGGALCWAVKLRDDEEDPL